MLQHLLKRQIAFLIESLNQICTEDSVVFMVIHVSKNAKSKRIFFEWPKDDLEETVKVKANLYPVEFYLESFAKNGFKIIEKKIVPSERYDDLYLLMEYELG